MKTIAFHFCPVCGEYLHAEKAKRSFALVNAPACTECNQPPQMTGLGIMLIGIVASLPTSLFLCTGATEVGDAILLGFMAVAVVRWIRQYKAKRRHAANKTGGR